MKIKNVLAFSLVMLLGLSFSFAITLKVNEGKVKFDNGSHNALTIEIFGVQEKEVLKAWADKMKDFKGDVDRDKHDVEAIGVTYFEVHEYQANYYATSSEKDGTVTFSVAVDLGGAYLNSGEHNSSYKKLEKALIEFAKNVIREQVKEELKEAEKEMDKQQKELESLQKKNKNLKEDIAGWKEDIKKAESDIVTNESEQKQQTEVVKKQKVVVDQIRKKQSQI